MYNVVIDSVIVVLLISAIISLLIEAISKERNSRLIKMFKKQVEEYNKALLNQKKTDLFEELLKDVQTLSDARINNHVLSSYLRRIRTEGKGLNSTEIMLSGLVNDKMSKNMTFIKKAISQLN